MNKLAKLTAGIVLALALTLTACGGGDDPKSLAKQNYEVLTEVQKLMAGGAQKTDPKVAELIKKSEAIDNKIKQLSEEDKKIFVEEAQKLIK